MPLAYALPTCPLPLEILDEIVGAAWDKTSNTTEDASRKTLLTLTSVSHTFYTLARKRLWESIILRYHPYRSSGSPRNNTQFHDILLNNPDLRTDICILAIEILIDDLEEITPDVIANPPAEAKEDRDSFLRVLYLLAASKVLEDVTIVTPPHPNPPYFLPMSAILDDETLFALTALRVCPSLEGIGFLDLVDPPPALVFGNPQTDAVNQASLLFSRSPVNNSHHDYTVDRQSTSFDIPDSVYDATKRAISCFTSPDPAPMILFPKLAVLFYVCPEERQHLLPEYLVEHGCPSKPWGGHMPLLEDLSITTSGLDIDSDSDFDEDIEDSAFIHTTSPFLKSLFLNGVAACRGVKDFDYLPQLSNLSFVCTLSRQDPDEDEWLFELSRLLGTIPPPHPLRLLSVQFRMSSDSIEEYRAELLSRAEFWTGLDDTFVQLAATLLSRRVAVGVEFLVGLEIEGDEPVDEAFGPTKAVVRGLLPRCRESSGVNLDIDAKLWRGADYRGV